MDDNEDNSRYKSKALGVNNQGYGSLLRLKVPAREYTTASNPYDDDEEEEEEDVEDEEMGEEVERVNGVRMIGKDSYDDDEEGDEEDSDDDNDEDDDKDDGGKRYNGKLEDIGMDRPQKKRKLINLISNYEFAPRVRAPSAHEASPSQPSTIRRNPVASWTEHETFVLLDAWGERFLNLGRKSLRSEEWQEVAEKVSQETNVERTESQCQNRLDTLKKKYRKEKMRLAAGGEGDSNWVHFKRMDMLLCSPPQQQPSLSCGIDSGQYVFMNPKVYLNRANGLDEMRDSPGDSESSQDEEDDSDGHPPKGKRRRGKTVDGSSFQLLADSMQKFSDIYEKIEIDKRKQMVEMENMRMDCHRQIEVQRRQILERAQAEIAKIREADDDENNLSAENLSG